MNCPNDNAEMRPVKIISHYGQPIFVDQCVSCGGIWFDESELFRAKQGEADKVDEIDMVDADSLRSPAEIKNALVCPRDGARLFRFTDKQFPATLALVRCPSCRGIWLNRGGFRDYQKNRAGLMEARKAVPKEPEFQKSVRDILITAPPAGGDSVMGRLGRFLNTDLEGPMARPSAAPATPTRAEETAGAAIGVLMTLLRLFLLK